MTTIDLTGITTTCTLPDCDGTGHNDGADRFCCARYTEVAVTASEISLEFTVDVYDAAWTDGPQVSVFGQSSAWEEAFLHRTTKPGELIALAERFEQLSDTLRRTAVELAGLRAGKAVAK